MGARLGYCHDQFGLALELTSKRICREHRRAGVWSGLRRRDRAAEIV